MDNKQHIWYQSTVKPLNSTINEAIHRINEKANTTMGVINETNTTTSINVNVVLGNAVFRNNVRECWQQWGPSDLILTGRDHSPV